MQIVPRSSSEMKRSICKFSVVSVYTSRSLNMDASSAKNLMKGIVSPAFTLIELLVVMAIIAILASIALPVFVGILERGQQTKDLSNAKQIGLGLKLYAGDNDGLFPTGTATNSNAYYAALIPTYIPTEKIFYLAKSLWSPN